MNNDRRDFDKNGLGWHQKYRRRDYDKDMESFCLHCDLRKEVSGKVSWKMFFIIIGGILTIIGTIAGIGAPIASNGIEKMVNTSQATLQAIHDVSERTTRIETRQEIIMDDVKLLKRRGNHADPDR